MKTPMREIKIEPHHYQWFRAWTMANLRARRAYQNHTSSTYMQPPDPEPRRPAVRW